MSVHFSFEFKVTLLMNVCDKKLGIITLNFTITPIENYYFVFRHKRVYWLKSVVILFSQKSGAK